MSGLGHWGPAGDIKVLSIQCGGKMIVDRACHLNVTNALIDSVLTVDIGGNVNMAATTIDFTNSTIDFNGAEIKGFTGNIEGNITGNFLGNLIIANTMGTHFGDVCGGNIKGNMTGILCSTNVTTSLIHQKTGAGITVVGVMTGTGFVGPLTGEVLGEVIGDVTGKLTGPSCGTHFGLVNSDVVNTDKLDSNGASAITLCANLVAANPLVTFVGNLCADAAIVDKLIGKNGTITIEGNIGGNIGGNFFGSFFGTLFGNICAQSMLVDNITPKTGTDINVLANMITTLNFVGNVCSDVVNVNTIKSKSGSINVIGNLEGNLEGFVIGNLCGNLKTLLIEPKLPGSNIMIPGNVVVNNLFGNVIGGNISGNITGILTGNFTGNFIGTFIGNLSGNVDGEIVCANTVQLDVMSAKNGSNIMISDDVVISGLVDVSGMVTAPVFNGNLMGNVDGLIVCANVIQLEELEAKNGSNIMINNDIILNGNLNAGNINADLVVSNVCAELIEVDILNAKTGSDITIESGNLVVGNVVISGKLSVGGLIDPIGLVLDEQSGVPAGAVAGKGVLWVKDDVPNNIFFTDDVGTDHTLFYVDGSLPVSGMMTISDTTQSTDKDTGALIVEGGVGVEKNVNVGGNVNTSGVYKVDGIKVVGPQGDAIANVSALMAITLTNDTGNVGDTVIGNVAIPVMGVDGVGNTAADVVEVNERLGQVNENISSVVEEVNSLVMDVGNVKMSLNVLLDAMRLHGLIGV